MGQLDRQVEKHLAGLKPVAQQLLAAEAFSLSTPVALLWDQEEGEVLPTTLNGLGTLLPASSALASPALQRFLDLREERGFDHAFEQCSADDEDGEEFCRVWDQAQEDLEQGVLLTTNDLVAFVTQAKRGWQETPRQLLVVSVRGHEVRSGLVSTAALAP